MLDAPITSMPSSSASISSRCQTDRAPWKRPSTTTIRRTFVASRRCTSPAETGGT
jgi:hypothetical protein